MPRSPTSAPVPGAQGIKLRGDPDFRARTEFLRRWWKEPQAYPDEFKSWLINFIEHHPDLLLEETAIPPIHWSKIIDPQTGSVPDEWILGAGPPSPPTGKVGDLYLDTTNNAFYEKTAVSTWTLRGNITGSPGAAGPVGPPGPSGQVYDSDQIGVVKAWTGKTIPENWALAGGQTLNENAGYTDLAAFAAAEVAAGNPLWGISGTAPNRVITLPNLKDKFLYGSNTPTSDIGQTGGVATAPLTISQIPAHQHGPGTLSTNSVSAGTPAGTVGAAGAHTHDTADGTMNFACSDGVNTITYGSGGTARFYIQKVQGISSVGNHGHTFTGSAMAGHAHSVTAGLTAAAGSGSAPTHENMPPYVRLAMIVKVKTVFIDSGVAKAGYYSTATHSAGSSISIPQSVHSLRSSRGLVVQCQLEASGEVVAADIAVGATGDVTVSFLASQAANSIRVTILG